MSERHTLLMKVAFQGRRLKWGDPYKHPEHGDTINVLYVFHDKETNLHCCVGLTDADLALAENDMSEFKSRIAGPCMNSLESAAAKRSEQRPVH